MQEGKNTANNMRKAILEAVSSLVDIFQLLCLALKFLLPFTRA